MDERDYKSGRDERGHFVKGVWKGGPGRPSRKRETARLEILAQIANEERWRAICEAAVNDAINGADGATRDRGRRWIAEYLIGKPQQTINLRAVEGDAWDEYSELSDDELRAIANSEDREGDLGSARMEEATSSKAGAGTSPSD